MKQHEVWTDQRSIGMRFVIRPSYPAFRATDLALKDPQRPVPRGAGEGRENVKPRGMILSKVFILSILMILSDKAFADEKHLLDEVKKLYILSETVVIINKGKTTIFKEPKGSKGYRVTDERINFVIFDGELKGKKTRFGLGASFRIIDDKVTLSPLVGEASRASVAKVEELLRSLARSEDFVPVQVE